MICKYCKYDFPDYLGKYECPNCGGTKMNITTAQTGNNWTIVVANAYGEPLATFDLCDEGKAYSFFLSQLNSDELAAERERVAAIESRWLIAAEDAANRRLAYCN